MDLIAIGQTVRRHKFAALPVFILTFVLVVYVMVLSKPDYQAAGEYALVSPPPPPTSAQIARDPALGRINPNNPLAANGLPIVAYLLTQAMGTQNAERQMLEQGVDPRSTVANGLATNTPVLTVTGVGVTAAQAVHSGMVLGQVLSKQLNTMQAQLGVSPDYRITVYPLVVPNQASLKVSSKLRDLIGVLALGVILLWVSVSIAAARAERKKAKASSDAAPDRRGSHATDVVPAVSAGAEFGVDGVGDGNDTSESVATEALQFLRHRG